jgi:hypothetical protein
MLAEAVVYLRSLGRTPPRFRRHLAGAVGLWARGVRQSGAWTQHIAETRGLIDTLIDDIKPRRTVAVLGSGPLFDVPLESLARTFERVLLVDHAHLATIDKRTRRYRNITLDWRELSSEGAPQPLRFLDDIADLDWVISANLLSQLARTAANGNEGRVIEDHLSTLARLSCPATLITDVEYRIVDRTGMLREEADLMYGRQMPKADLSWKWEVAPFGEESRQTRRVHQVCAWLDWRRGAVPPAV